MDDDELHRDVVILVVYCTTIYDGGINVAIMPYTAAFRLISPSVHVHKTHI